MSEDIKYYYVDESGDPTFYNKKGRLIIGGSGASSILILGFISTKNPNALKTKLLELKQALIEEKEFYSEYPSFEKTLKHFHAKDDIPEIRKQVYDLLGSDEMDFKAEFIVARKIEGIFEHRHHKSENEFYFDIVSHLFSRKINANKQIKIYFSKKDTKTKQKHFEQALERSKEKYQKISKKEFISEVEFFVQTPGHESCLQIIDYLNWAVYRAYTRGEMRWFNKVRDKVSLLVDIYDEDKYPASWYNKRTNPFDISKVTPLG